jgi:hypothetical protein
MRRFLIWGRFSFLYLDAVRDRFGRSVLHSMRIFLTWEVCLYLDAMCDRSGRCA